MFERLEEAYRRYRRKRTLADIRATITLFGYDTTHISDDDLEEKWLEFQRRIREALPRVSASAEQAGKAFEDLGRSLQKMQSALLNT